ncbi:MAG: response regulator transcription factor [Lentimicrobiaceae bacterium]|nr:response regulator transcription factor [Lentimicrobiaceae bacterium]
MNLKAKILLVEDDLNLSSLLCEFLETKGHSVVHALDGSKGMRLFMNNHVNLCILDVMLPLKDGFTLATEIRQLNKHIPIIFLTARNRDDDRIHGFRSGCDDYITKPFSSEELNLRIQAILKRCLNMKAEGKGEIYFFGKSRFDSGNMLLVINDKQHQLTPKESALLKLLCLNKNNLLPREQALHEIWGDADYFIGRSMDVFIARLRKYLKDDPEVSIQNVHGSGFKLEVKEL